MNNKYVHCVKVVPDIQVTSSIVKEYCMDRAVNEYLQFIVALLALISSYDYKLRVVNSSNYHYILILVRNDELARISVNLGFLGAISSSPRSLVSIKTISMIIL